MSNITQMILLFALGSFLYAAAEAFKPRKQSEDDTDISLAKLLPYGIIAVLATLVVNSIDLGDIFVDSGSRPTPTITITPTYTSTPIPPVETITLADGVQAPKSDFLFPESSSEYLSYETLNQKMESSDKWRMRSLSQQAINEIFARHGYTFVKNTGTAKEARERYEGKGWYVQMQAKCPVGPGEQNELRTKYFNQYERDNVKLILEWQNTHGVPEDPN